MSSRGRTPSPGLKPAGDNGKRRHTHVTIHTEAWRDEAACRDIDPDVFHPDATGAEGRRQVADARAICDACPVRLDCLAYALAAREELGVWGGTTDRQRRVLRRLIESPLVVALVALVQPEHRSAAESSSGREEAA